MLRLLSLAAVLLAALPAQAELISEVRAGALAQDILRPEADKDKEANSLTLGIEALSPKLFADASAPLWQQIILQPRVHVGVTANTKGYTHTAYTGLTWGHEFAGGFFLEGSFGGAVHDGELDYKDNPATAPVDFLITGRPQLGSRLLFREGFEAGYRFSNGVGVSAQISHMSNADLASSNDGMTWLGVRTSYQVE